MNHKLQKHHCSKKNCSFIPYAQQLSASVMQDRPSIEHIALSITPVPTVTAFQESGLTALGQSFGLGLARISCRILRKYSPTSSQPPWALCEGWRALPPRCRRLRVWSGRCTFPCWYRPWRAQTWPTSRKYFGWQVQMALYSKGRVYYLLTSYVLVSFRNMPLDV